MNHTTTRPKSDSIQHNHKTNTHTHPHPQPQKNRTGKHQEYITSKLSSQPASQPARPRDISHHHQPNRERKKKKKRDTRPVNLPKLMSRTAQTYQDRGGPSEHPYGSSDRSAMHTLTAVRAGSGYSAAGPVIFISLSSDAAPIRL